MPYKAEASFTHSKRWREHPKLPDFAERLECVKLASAFGSEPLSNTFNRACPCRWMKQIDVSMAKMVSEPRLNDAIPWSPPAP